MATKKGVNGSQKGAAFERLIAKQFSLWISQGKSQDLLWRSAGSGGRSTMRRKKTGKGIENHASDIAPLHPDAEPFSGMFTLECKNYASLSIPQLVYDSTGSQVNKWWLQACRDAASVNRVPLLVMRELRRPTLLMFGVVPGWMSLIHGSGLHWAVFPDIATVVVNLDGFLANVPFTTMRDLHGRPVPRSSHNRLALHEQPTRRVPLRDF